MTWRVAEASHGEITSWGNVSIKVTIGTPVECANVRTLRFEITRQPFSNDIGVRPNPLPGRGRNGEHRRQMRVPRPDPPWLQLTKQRSELSGRNGLCMGLCGKGAFLLRNAMGRMRCTTPNRRAIAYVGIRHRPVPAADRTTFEPVSKAGSRGPWPMAPVSAYLRPIPARLDGSSHLYRWNGNGQSIFGCTFIPIAAMPRGDAGSSAGQRKPSILQDFRGLTTNSSIQADLKRV
jgi:hypothetical protein